MIIQNYPDELDYVNAQLALKGEGDKSFLGLFCQACVRADHDNYELLRPIVQVFIHTHPADPELLRRERRDRGADGQRSNVGDVRDAPAGE